MNEPGTRTLEFARRLVIYDPAVNPRQLTILTHDFIYQTEKQAREAYDALIVKASVFLEEYWLETQVLAWNAVTNLKGEA